MIKPQAPTRRWLLWVLAVAAAMRLTLLQVYQPVAYGDTPSYWRLAEAICNGWQRYDGTRTPGYPLFLALFATDRQVWLAQMVLGLVITLLLFYLGWQISSQPWFGALTGLAHTLNLGQLFFEANLLTETASTFWLILTVSGTVLWISRPGWRRASFAAVLAISASLAWLTRPLFLYLPLWLILFIALERGPSGLNIRWLPAAAFALPAMAIFIVWVQFIHARFSTWSISAMSGYNLIQHTGGYFELVPDEYAALRDTYLKYRDRRIAEYGTQTNTIWEAIPEMSEVSGQSFYQLSRTLTRLSLQLIWEHPDLYLRNVVRGWWLFWRAPVYWSSEAVRFPSLAGAIAGAVLLERALLLFVNLIFVLASIAAVLFRRIRTVLLPSPAVALVLGVIWLGSITQTLLDHGDNPRFLVPMQSLVMLFSLWALYHLAARWRGQSGLPEASA